LLSNHRPDEDEEHDGLLPFGKRGAKDDEVEIDDDDLVVIDDGAVATAPYAAHVDVDVDVELGADDGARASDEDLAATVARKRPTIPASRRVLDGGLEEDVAGECLASIAAEVAPRAPAFTLPPPSSASVPAPALVSGGRLPSVTAPPFLRTSTIPLYAAVPGMREAAPASAPSVFARRSAPSLSAPSASSLSGVAAAREAPSGSVLAPSSPSGASVVPVSAPPRTVEPTVILVRERPKAGWVIGSAAVGAVCALVAARLLGTGGVDRPPPAPAAALAAPPLAPVTASAAVASQPVAPAAVSSAAAPAASSVAPATSVVAPAVVRFGDDQAVAIDVAKPVAASPRVPAPSAKPVVTSPATTPVAPSARPPAKPAKGGGGGVGPALPDGSFTLGARTEAKPSPSSPSIASAAAEPAPKRNVSPGQQLAEAQLRASMR